MAARFSKFFENGRKIIAVGRNYKDHAAELGNAVPEKPILFMKPASSYILQGRPILIPKGCKNLQHEIELGVVISQKATKISEDKAMDYVAGYCLALDMTARDFQNAAKEKGLPWDMAKGFDTSCPVSDFIPRTSIKDPHNLKLWCKVNKAMKQDGNTGDMIFKIPYLLAYITQFFTLEPNDVVLTGTPAGVSSVRPGDVIEGGINDLIGISFEVKASE